MCYSDMYYTGQERHGEVTRPFEFIAECLLLWCKEKTVCTAWCRTSGLQCIRMTWAQWNTDVVCSAVYVDWLRRCNSFMKSNVDRAEMIHGGKKIIQIQISWIDASLTLLPHCDEHEARIDIFIYLFTLIFYMYFFFLCIQIIVQ